MLLTNNQFMTEKCTELTSYRMNLECFSIALGDDKSVFDQMSYFRRCLARVRLSTTACHNCTLSSLRCPVSVNHQRYNSRIKSDSNSTEIHLKRTCFATRQSQLRSSWVFLKISTFAILISGKTGTFFQNAGFREAC